MKVKLKSIETHVIDSCNLACEFCSHYSNLKPATNMLTLNKAEEEWSNWASKVEPNEFIMLGGEPTLNPKLPDLIALARNIWKTSKIRLITNGMFLERLPSLQYLLANQILTVTLHLSEAENNKIVSYVQNTFGHICEISFNYTHEGRWLQFYKLEHGVPIPFTDNNPRSSWECCVAKTCHVLKDNKLWKCPQVAYASTVDIDWFKDYKYATLDDDILAWSKREEESCCSNCPAHLVPALNRENLK